MPFRRSLLSAMLVLSCWIAAPAHAQEPRERARGLFQDGVAQYDGGEYAAALRSFEEAYRIAPHPAVRVNIANCLEQLGRYSEAMASYRTYLEEMGARLKPAERSEIERTIERLQSRFGTLDIELSPADARLTLDGLEPVRSPNGEVSVTPGEHVLRAELEGYETRQQIVTVAGGSTQTVQLTLEKRAPRLVAEPLPPPQQVQDDEPVMGYQPVEAREPRRLKPWVWLSAGATVLLAAGFATSAGLTYREQQDFDRYAEVGRQAPLGSPLSMAAFARGQEAGDNAERLARISDVLLGCTVAAGATTLVLWLLDRRAERQSALRAQPLVGRAAAGFSLGGQF